ncbi:hypothetical protein G9U51_12745 [Calidifontibacter sp. DB0510]|uniref:WD40 repeat domain-containing protein n=1 Tax=Metallococcus carri TaxID=1656884 RepID=A0A967B289_9MICO|nr:hypothetical protein [Metallococcus carri]NHN56649.1 hypothetical protein [Metallococcus carri]NOP38948.1 hypothetical protein [Calidifontibacter sp. DB2511S]
MSHNRIRALVGSIALSATVGGVALAGMPGAQAATELSVPAQGSKALGWTAVIKHQTGAYDNQGQLFLASPTGGAKYIGEVSDNAGIADVSYDARYVATVRQTSTGQKVAVWNTSTRALRILEVPGKIHLYADKVVAVTATQATTYSAVTGAKLSSFAINGGFGSTVSPLGGSLVVGAPQGKSVNVYDMATQRLVRTVDKPQPYEDCKPVGGFDATNFQMLCSVPSGFGAWQVYAEGYRTATPERYLTPVGLDKAYNTSPRLARQSGGDNTVRTYDVATNRPVGPTWAALGGAYGSKVIGGPVTTVPQTATSLVSWDAVTKTSTTLMTGLITAAKTVDGT